MQNSETLVTSWYRDTLADTVSRASLVSIEQIQGAIADLRTQLAAADFNHAPALLDPWFAEHLQRPPVSHDTALYNALQEALPALRHEIGFAAGEKRTGTLGLPGRQVPNHPRDPGEPS